MSTDPTIPRHPTNPILSIVLTPDCEMMKSIRHKAFLYAGHTHQGN
jgi:hypothetical protein